MIGTTVGNYRIVERLGDGGMGAVYRAVDEMLDRDVAIKVLKPELARNAALIERFRQEAIALARLNHPRIATLHGLERHGESLLMILEYVRGDTLEAIVQRSGRLSWQRAAELCAATLDALDHAHDKGVVHRDIKPANIMLATTGAVKVMDFGIARLIGKNRQTQVGHAVGTPMYMAPEQLRGEEVDGRTDLYATGAVLFELTTGRMAFEADSDYALMMMQLNEPPPPASLYVADVPPALDAIITRAMAKRREDRFPNATTFRKALEQLVRVHAAAPRPIVPVETRLASNTPPDVARNANGRQAAPAPAATRLAQATHPERPAVAATRLAPDSPPATRLAPNAVSGPPPATRLAPNVAVESPPTRLAADAGSYQTAATSSRAVTAPTRSSAAAWIRDWRAYAVAGALFIGAGLTVRTLRPPIPERLRPDSVRVDTASATTPARSTDTTRIVPTLAQEPRRETAEDLVVNPPLRPVADRGEGVVAQPPEGPKPPKSGGTDGRSTRPPDEKAGDKIAPPTDVPVEAKPSDADVASAIRDALHFAASSLSGRNPAAASLLASGIQDQWIALMKEGRIAVSMNGSPEIERNGSRASAAFDASVNVRSPFGANRRQTARFAAELQRSDGGWRVVSLKPIGGLELK